MSHPVWIIDGQEAVTIRETAVLGTVASKRENNWKEDKMLRERERERAREKICICDVMKQKKSQWPKWAAAIWKLLLLKIAHERKQRAFPNQQTVCVRSSGVYFAGMSKNEARKERGKKKKLTSNFSASALTNPLARHRRASLLKVCDTAGSVTRAKLSATFRQGFHNSLICTGKQVKEVDH